MFEHIIFAHHDLETRSFFYDIFTNMGYRITTAIANSEILELLKKERPDYVVADPGMSDIPLDLLRDKIKAIDARIEIIALDAHGDNSPQAISKGILAVIRSKGPGITPQAKDTGMRPRRNILIVDDDLECAELLGSYLSRKGYNVEKASTAEEAMLKINMSKPDIILLDIYMPNMDGMLALKAIKERDKEITVIMTSAVEDPKVIAEATKLGANGYLVKPFDPANLDSLLSSEALQNQTPPI